MAISTSLLLIKKIQTTLNSYFFTDYASLYGGKGRGQ
jgi:hypothetical protein